MSSNGHCFVEWKEQFVSQEQGNRVIHFFLKDSAGESILAVVATERSLRHMLYVVAEEFLQVCGTENSIYADFKWRSRREAVDWLTSMLSKQHLDRSNVVPVEQVQTIAPLVEEAPPVEEVCVEYEEPPPKKHKRVKHIAQKGPREKIPSKSKKADEPKEISKETEMSPKEKKKKSKEVKFANKLDFAAPTQGLPEPGPEQQQKVASTSGSSTVPLSSPTSVNKGKSTVDRSVEPSIGIGMALLLEAASTAFEETDSIFADLDQLISGDSSLAASSTTKKGKPDSAFSEEEISKAKKVFENSLNMKFEVLLHSDRQSEFMEALRTLHLSATLSEGQNPILEKFHSTFPSLANEFLSMEKEKNDVQKLIDSRTSLANTLKQLKTDYKAFRTQEESIDREILKLQEEMKKKEVSKSELYSKRKKLAREAQEKKPLLAKYNLEAPSWEERKKKADEASKQVSSSWEDFRKNFGEYTGFKASFIL